MHEMPMEIERKYLILRPAPETVAALAVTSHTQITQTYLLPKEQGFSRRVRKRGTPETGWEYTYTQKKPVRPGERIELEEIVTEEEYHALLKETLPGHYPVEKERICFLYEGQLFELDLYAFSKKLSTLEIELPSLDIPVQLPDWVELVADVTGDPAYSNHMLSISLAFPEPS